jgi:lipopolysaccharide export system protein LptA
LVLVAVMATAWGVAETAKKQPQASATATDTTRSRNDKLIRLLHSDSLSYDEQQTPGLKILRGNVVLRHEDALLYCDSAYFYEPQNSIDAYGRVRMLQSDSVMAYGETLFYDGNTRIGRLRGTVRLIHKSYTMTQMAADSVVYDRMRGVAYFERGGVIRDELNTLRSVRGEYTPARHQSVFYDNIHLRHPNFALEADTLYYNTSSHIAELQGPTNIEYQDSTHIYSTDGWYNTQTEQSMLLRRSIVTHQTGQTMTSDTIFYDKRNKFGRLFGHMHMTDSAQQKTLYGNYGEMWEKDKRGYATREALLVDWSDSIWTYVHADTLRTEDTPYRLMVLTTLNDSLQTVDTSYVDTITNWIRAYRHVRIYRSDVQAVCDSMSWQDRDSVLRLFYDPICWQQDMQVSADSAQIYIQNGTVDHICGQGNALAIKHEVLEYYDQCAGKDMTAYIEDDTIRRIDVNANARTIFFPKEDDGSYLGMNVTESNFIKVYFVNQEPDHSVFTQQSQCTLYPMDKIPAGLDRLSGFFWADAERPKRPGAVMQHPKRTERPSAVISASK